MARPGRQTREQGFALIEALASLVVVSMIGMMIVEGVGTGRRVWERVDEREARGEVLDAAQAALRDRVEEIYPSTLYDKSPPYIDFDGRAQRMVFLANPPDSERPGPLKRYTLRLAAGGQLVLESVSDIALAGARPSARVLLANVRRLDLDYFGATGPDQPRGWRDDWENQAALPEVVRIRLQFEPGDVRRWPDLIIRPRTTIDTSCMLNPVTHHCKGRV